MALFGLSLVCLLLNIGCTNSETSIRSQIKDELSKIGVTEIRNSTVQIIEEWRADSLGCLKLRDKNKTQLLARSLEFVGRSKEQLIVILGTPNSVLDKDEYMLSKKGELFDILRYYFDTFCDGNAIIDAFDKCWIDFLISTESKTLVDISYVCE